MKAERARLKRLQRLERVRAIAKQAAASEAAQAEGTLAQLDALAQRSQRLALDYANRNEALDGAALQQLSRFAGGLRSISENTASDAVRARQFADTKLELLAAAERRRAAVETRADKQAQNMAKREIAPATGVRRGFGTGLE